MDNKAKDVKKSDLQNDDSFLETLTINNLLSAAINVTVIMVTVALIYVVAVPLGVGMGSEFLAVLIAPAMYVYLGYKLLSPVQKHLWASVMGSAVVATVISGLVHLSGLISIEEWLILMLPSTVLVPPFCMYLGLRIRARNNNKGN
ncbi:MAG: hypothetical protein FWC81_00840 [Coriobacteriia bacterium]|nr:hypothetical protein [Coriobacteriia bacterium]MCL2605916.1 hypothetical protein [Coriobacteriia bacterium]